MKIDIHLHTKKVKSGDSPKRDITPASFCSEIGSTDVEICAITNHNHFDLAQYEEIVKLSDDEFQVWPGIELDVEESGRRGHLLIIVNPKEVKEFDSLVLKMIGSDSPDSFSIGIPKMVSIFDALQPVYIPHYLNKKPSFGEEEIEVLTQLVLNPRRILKEATNSISAGIFIRHGHKTIYGSDIQDWSDYQSISKSLPDLRLPVESFEQFCLLLDRDDSTIKTILEKKNHKDIIVKPFAGEAGIELEIFDDINVFFGSKGTGKTEILKALSKLYNKSGHRTQVFESNVNSLEGEYDIKGNRYKVSLEELKLDACSKEFAQIRAAKEASVTSLKKYFEYFSEGETNRIAKNIKIKEFVKQDSDNPSASLEAINDLLNDLLNFISKIKSNNMFKDIIGKALFNQLEIILKKVQSKIIMGLEEKFIEYQTAILFNQLVEVFATEISRKTGKPERPTTVGFLGYASNRLSVEKSALKLSGVLNSKLQTQAEYVGNIGEKGKLFCKTDIRLQNGEVNSSKYRHIGITTKNPQKQIARSLDRIKQEVYSDVLFAEIEKLNKIENGESITSIEEMILFRRYFEANHQEYKPSNGESAMILLSQELASDKEIFIIDEPEKSLGNDYINDFIVPLLKAHAYSGKRVIIATHDANIAVRTLPYNTIYREHDMTGYNTYRGNPFSNNLVCNRTGQTLDWKETSMRILEGGKAAFGERGKIYGKV